MSATKRWPLTPHDVDGGAFTWDGDDELFERIQDTAIALAESQAEVERLRAEFAEVLVSNIATAVRDVISKERARAQVEGGDEVANLRAELAAARDEAAGLRAWPEFHGAKLSVAARSVLNRRGVDTVADLVALTPDKMLRMSGVGPKFREQIIAAQRHCAERSDPTGGILGSGR